MLQTPWDEMAAFRLLFYFWVVLETVSGKECTGNACRPSGSLLFLGLDDSFALDLIGKQRAVKKVSARQDPAPDIFTADLHVAPWTIRERPIVPRVG